jgi:carboxylesterase type B
LSGFNRDEAGLALELIDDIAKLFTGGRDVLLRKGNYEAAMQYIFGNSSNEVLEAYPSSEVPDENLDSLGRAATDLLVACPKRQAALSLSKQQNVYFYSFEFQPRFIPVIQRCKSKEVCHGLELPYVFHSLQNWMIIPKFSREEHKISHALIDYFTSFASSTLDQGKFDKFMAHDMGKDKDSLSQLPAWAPITVEQQNYLKFTNDADVILTDQPWNRHCDMWDRLDYIF